MADPRIRFQPFPKLDARLTNEDGTISLAWYRLLISLWNRTGSNKIIDPRAVVLQLDPDGIVELIDSTTGEVLGTVVTTAAFAGGPARRQVVGASPFVFVADGPGTVVVFAAQAELSRDGGATWFKVTLQGGAVPVLIGDRVRVTWYGAGADNLPEVTFFPWSPAVA